MLSYETLKNKAREFLAATGLRVEEFQQLLPAFESAYEKCYPSHQTVEGKPRRRRAGGGARGLLNSSADRLLFILIREDQPAADNARLAIRLEPAADPLLDSSVAAGVAAGVSRFGHEAG